MISAHVALFLCYNVLKDWWDLMQDKILEVVSKAGVLLIESGAEIYRVEDTMLHLAKSFKGVEDAQSYVSATGVMLSIKMNNQNTTKIFRVGKVSTNLDCIHAINALSREASIKHYDVEYVAKRLDEIQKAKLYPWWIYVLASGFGAAGFCGFFRGNTREIILTFIIGIIIALVTNGLKKLDLNSFFVNAIASAVMTLVASFFYQRAPLVSFDILIISSIMLLVPGLAITNAIRDILHGDYVSGLARICEAFVCAIAIATGVGFILSLGV